MSFRSSPPTPARLARALSRHPARPAELQRVLALAVAAWLVGCGSSHGEEDGGPPLSDAGFAHDALPDGSPPDGSLPDVGAHPRFAVLHQEGAEAVIREVDASHPARELARVPLGPGESARFFWGGPTRDVGTLRTVTPAMEGDDDGALYLVSLDGGPHTNVTLAIEALEPDGPCSNPLLSRARWSSDGRSLYQSCERRGTEGRESDAAVYHVHLSGEIQRLGGDCAEAMATTNDGRVLLRDGDRCGFSAPAVLFDPRAGSSQTLEDVNDDDRILYWDPTVRGFVVATETLRGRSVALSDLRWASPSGLEGALLRTTLPFVPVVLGPTPNGDALLVGERAPDGGAILGFHILGLRDDAETVVRLPEGCSGVFGDPLARWSHDGSRFYVYCADAVRIVQRDGTITRAESGPVGPRIPVLGWSEDSTRILRHAGDGAYDLIDARDGSTAPLPPAVTASGPLSVDWRSHPRHPDCGRHTSC